MSQGSQKILYQFQTPLDSDYLNSAFQDIFSLGIYTGFTVNILGDTSVQVNTGKYIISDGTYSAIIENQAAATITIGVATPYIIIRYTYLKQANNFAVISAVAHASILSTDIIIGKGIFNGSTLDSIDYTQQTKPVKVLSENLFDNIKVLENSTPAMNVVVNAGAIVTNDGARHIFSSTTTKTISAADATHPRIDLIVVDISGVIQVVSGTPAASPATPSYSNYFVLAEVYVAANVTEIYQDNITDARNFFTSALTFASIFNAISGLSTLDPLLSTDVVAINRSNVGYKSSLSVLSDFGNSLIVEVDEDYEIPTTLPSGTKILVSPNSSTQKGVIIITVPLLASSNYKWYEVEFKTGQGLIQLDGNGTDILFKGQVATTPLIYSKAGSYKISNNGTNWILKGTNLFVRSWDNRSEYRNKHIAGNAVNYDNGSGTSTKDTDWTGMVITEATSNFTAVVVEDTGGTGTSGILYVYELSSGFTYWTNNRVLTASNGQTIDINEPTGSSSLNIDSNLYHGFGVFYMFYTAKLMINTTATFTGAFIINIDYGDNLTVYNIDSNQIKLQTDTSGLLYDNDSGVSTYWDTENGFENIILDFSC